MHDTDDIGSNESGNPHLQEMIEARLQRRTFLQGSSPPRRPAFSAAPCSVRPRLPLRRPAPCRVRDCCSRRSRRAPTTRCACRRVTRAHVLVPWGTPLLPGAAAFAEDASNTAAEQALQVGFNHDGMHFFPLVGPFGDSRGLLVVNHEYTDANQIYTAAPGLGDHRRRGGPREGRQGAGRTRRHRRRDPAGRDGRWQHVRGVDRTTAASPARRRWRSPARCAPTTRCCSPRSRRRRSGTLNNCAHGLTPWGTYLACEENWNGYFGTDDAAWTRNAARGALRRVARRASATTGTRPSRASTSPGTATSSTTSAGSSRSIPSIPTPRPSSARRSAASSTRARPSPRARAASSSTPATTRTATTCTSSSAARPGASCAPAARARSTTARCTSPSSTPTAPAPGCRWCTARAR